jgi:hypothetical protein
MKMNTTAFSLVYDSFLSKITDDMYLELTELDTFRMLEELLLSAIEKFEFPRINLWDYQKLEENGEEYFCFNNELTREEINILAVYMIV